jgi:hypothetical protein
MSDSKNPDKEDSSASWPFKTLLFLGTFGDKDPAGRRFHRRGYMAAFALLVVLLLPKWRLIYPHAVLDWIILVGPGLTFGFIAWEFWRYLSSLDELGRRLQLEAAAVAYLVSSTLIGILLGFSYVDPWKIPTLLYLAAWIITIEPIRGIALARLARKYR